MARRQQEESAGGGLPAWLATYGDLATLLLCFFVLLFSMSSVDVTKFKAAMDSFADQIDIMPGGIALTGEELITNGVSQLGEIELILANKNPTTDDSDNKDLEIEDSKDSEDSKGPEDTKDITTPAAEEIPGIYNSITKEIAEDIRASLTTEGIEANIQLSYNSNYVKLTIKGEALFDLSKAELKPEAKKMVGIIADLIIEKAYKDYSIQVDGHTDNWQINTVQYPSNWYLSSARAIAVGNLLVDQYKFSPDLIACTGYGEHRPIADNNTPEGRAINRRVEIKLIFQTDEVISEDILQ